MSESVRLAFREMTNLDLAVLIHELQALVGTRLDKIYQTGPMEFVFRFKTKDLIVLIPYALFAAEREAQEKEPTTFATSLRKHLENRILESIEQPYLDRICIMKFGEVRLVLEFFGKGNLVLIDSSDKIRLLLRKEDTKQRTLKIGEKYILPEMKKAEPTRENIEKLLSQGQNEKVVVVLSRNINMPALYLNELLIASSIDPRQTVKDLKPTEYIKIADAIFSFFESVTGGKANPVLKDDGSYFAAKFPGSAGRFFTSLSELLAEVFKHYKEEEKKEAISAETERLLKKLKHQEDRIQELKKEIEIEGELGSKVLGNEPVIQELSEKLKMLRKEGKNWEEIEAELNKIHPLKIEKGKIVLEL